MDPAEIWCVDRVKLTFAQEHDLCVAQIDSAQTVEQLEVWVPYLKLPTVLWGEWRIDYDEPQGGSLHRLGL